MVAQQPRLCGVLLVDWPQHEKYNELMHGNRNRRLRGLGILYEDGELIAVDKAHGILTEQTVKREKFTALDALTDYIRKGQSRSSKRLYLVHRLDRDTSGVLLFAKSEKAMDFLKEVWHTEVEKRYLAVVCGRLTQEEGEIRSFLYEDKDLFVRSIAKENIKDVPPQYLGRLKEARTLFRKLDQSARHTLLEATLPTGRRNQIRVHFASMGHPVLGDPKYGTENAPSAERMCLHSSSLSFPHPATKKRIVLKAETPHLFMKLFPSLERYHDK